MANYTRKAVRGAGIVFVMMVASYFLGYIFRLIMARELGVSSYGLVYAVIALFGFFSIFYNLGLGSALVKYIAQFRVENKPEKIKGSIIIVLFSRIFLSVLICGTLILSSDIIASEYFNAPEASILIKIYGVGIIFSAIIGTLKASFQGFQHMRYYSSIDFVKSIIVLTLTLPLLRMGFKEMGPILGFALAFIIFLPLIYLPVLIKRVFPEFLRTRATLTKSLTKKLFVFGIPVMFTSIAGIIFGYTGTLILTYFRPLEEVGLYNAAFPTMKLISVTGVVLASVILPLSSELWATEKKKQLSKGLGILYKYALIFVFPIALLMFLFPEIILGILFGGEFRQAGTVLRILTVGYFLHTLTVVNNSTLSGMGKPKEVSKIMLSGAGMNMILNLVLIPIYGMEGAAVSTSIAFITIFILSIRKIRDYISFILPWRDFMIIGLSGLLITCLAYLIKMIDSLEVWPKLAITVTVGSVLYISILFLSKILNPTDLKEILKRVK